MATNTYVALDKVTLGTATPSITFSSIPSTYTDLVIVINGGTATSTNATLRFNGDTGNNYSSTHLYGDGSSAGSFRYSSVGALQINYYAYPENAFDFNAICQIQNYSNATTYKTAIARANKASNGVNAAVGLWRNTAAITSVTVRSSDGTTNWNVGSTFSLYGIASTTAQGAKAEGGIITSDDVYWYHTFRATGTFTPLQSLSVDSLVLAGAGGGGNAGGGGGAGGYRTATAQSVTATNYTVTVGAGGAGAPAGSPYPNGSNGLDSVFNSITSTAGGGGGGYSLSGNNGGSGGGIGQDSQVGDTFGLGNTPSTSPSQGNDGGTGLRTGAQCGAGGGGGAGGAGGNGTGTTAGAAGLGTTNSFSGVSTTYATGGAGSFTAGTLGEDGTANLGQGGGGSNNTGSFRGGNGGSGIVIVRYLKA
jgi:hypothetical protein